MFMYLYWLSAIRMISIAQLFIKAQSWQAMQAMHELVLEKNIGIIWDKSAILWSPRQVLISTTDDHQKIWIGLDQLRSNIVLDGVFLSDIQSGDELYIGNTRIRITYICEPCRHLFEVAGFLTDDRPTLIAHRWMLGIVIQSWAITIGDELVIAKNKHTALPDSNFERFCAVVRSIPQKQYISYSDVVFLMGAPTQYVRAIPGYVKKAEQCGIDCSRIQNKEYLESISPESIRDFSSYFQSLRV